MRKSPKIREVECIMRRWLHGGITWGDVVYDLIAQMDKTNIREAMVLVSPEMVEAIRRHFGQLPQTDEEWENMKLCHIGGFVPRVPLTREELKEIYTPRSPSAEQVRQMKAEAELFREYFASLDGGDA